MQTTVLSVLFAVLLATATATATEIDPRGEAILPPEIPWAGRSQSLAVPASDPWATPAEKSQLARTPSYDDTVAWLRRLVDAAPELHLVSIGRSAEGRDIWMVIASREKAFTPEALKATGKPTLLAHGGIHAGEIDGKDAGLMLLRDLTVRGSRRALLDRANWLFVPILNVDGHERASRFTRINQRGPIESGWRTNARNLNLNRDFAKLDAAETRAIVAVLNRWDPELYVDMHVTDGLDHQYDITWGDNAGCGWSPAIEEWVGRVFTPTLRRDLAAMGHVPGPLWVAYVVDPADFEKGFVQPIMGPRLSTGYATLRHVPTLLLENHSLKPYPQRVFGTYVFLESALRLVGEEASALRAATAEDRRRRPDTLAVEFGLPPEGAPRPRMEYLGVESRVEKSALSGGSRVTYTGRPVRLDVPLVRFHTVATVSRPRAYWVPAAWSDVIDRLVAHGIEVERITVPREVDVEMSRIRDPRPAAEPFEGRTPLTASFATERRRERFAAGSARVTTDQALGDLAVVLLEPSSPDSFFRWGFFLEVLQPTEYVEGYVMEPMAERMLALDPALRAEFERLVREDPAFASPADRLQWLYRKTLFADDRWRLYPVGREPR
jgi:hypothetical protein